MKKRLAAVVLASVATIAFAQFYANWPETYESPSAAYIVAGIFLIISILLLVIDSLHKNQNNLDDCHFRGNGKSDEE